MEKNGGDGGQKRRRGTGKAEEGLSIRQEVNGQLLRKQVKCGTGIFADGCVRGFDGEAETDFRGI